LELVLFYVAAAVTVAAAVLVVTCLNAAHALIHLVVSLLATAVMLYLLGAPFAAMLQIIVYAGAIVVLFVFVVMMLDLGQRSVARERAWLDPRLWIAPGLLSAILFGELLWLLLAADGVTAGTAVGPDVVGRTLYGPWLLVVELAAILLLAALVGANHLGRRYLRARRSLAP
jgi:NADH-quinone oxidoreductase subunit J